MPLGVANSWEECFTESAYVAHKEIAISPHDHFNRWAVGNEPGS